MIQPALVLSGHVIALGVTRALGEAAIPVFIATYEPGDIAQVSRYVHGAFSVPNPLSDEAAFIARLVEIGHELNRPLLIPGDDASLLAVSRHRDALTEWFVVACPPAETVARIIDKRLTYQIAREAGVPVPRTLAVASAHAAGEAADQIGYPCLIKPTESHFYYDHFGVKYRLAGRRSEAEAAFTEAEQAGVSVMVQEFIAGDDCLGVNYNAYAINGEVRVDFTAHKVRMSPPGGGVPSAVLSRHVPEVIALGRKTLKAIGFDGYACTEFKWDARGKRYVLFEVNGRYNRSNLLATHCGINFPLLEYHHRINGVLPAPPENPPRPAHWIDEFKDLASFLRRVRLAPRNILLFWRPYFGNPVFAVFCWHDLRPFLRRVKIVLRSLVRAGAKLFRRETQNSAPLSKSTSDRHEFASRQGSTSGTPSRRRRRLLLAGVSFGVAACVYVLTIRDFLAITEPVGGEILVVESWFAVSPTLQDAAAAVRHGHYKRIVCVALADFSEAEAGDHSGAERAAKYLIGAGVDPSLVQVLSVPYVENHRTYTGAVAVRNWLQQEYPGVRSLDVFTKSIHARKSQMIYRKAFAAPVRVGIIAGAENPYPHKYWWLSRRGIYVMVRNTLGYLYALTFSPPSSGLAPQTTNPPPINRPS